MSDLFKLKRGDELTCTACQASTQVIKSDTLPTGWIVLRIDGDLYTFCPEHDPIVKL